ncbi:Ubiquinone biosynthesis O-methyltransferase, mitochondrial [Dichanthelium oligosanthes]|uniref:Ubiquinone biosynthesis O-methyltransferase, mitochondrial n=1 Tax=Dichanthelium oligosanthes TaxID=888268 RepID=A0A1E5W2K1_9POAL|nr:Ubiquinone biosynthesis O-methyltransferase, mitochondrial [Dichanthelium oligosanthes]
MLRRVPRSLRRALLSASTHYGGAQIPTPATLLPRPSFPNGAVTPPRDPYSSKPLEGLKVIDVGCGGGILSEVIEHIANPLEFCESLSALTVPNGATVVSTINHSMRAYATAIVAAEYILKWLPRGTHEWSKLVTPEELSLMLQKASVSVEEMAGFVYNPLSGEWSLLDDISVSYIAFGVKKSFTINKCQRGKVIIVEKELNMHLFQKAKSCRSNLTAKGVKGSAGVKGSLARTPLQAEA